jgi:hypothetical protein
VRSLYSLKVMSFTGCVWPTGSRCGPGLSARTLRACGGGRPWSSCPPTARAGGRWSPAWTRPPGRPAGRSSFAGSVEGSYPTADDGGLALLRWDDTLEMVDLSSVRIRWTRPAGDPPDSGQSYPPPMAVAGGAVLFAVNGQLTSYDDRPDPVDRCADAHPAGSRPGRAGVQAVAGLVSLTWGGTAGRQRATDAGVARHQRGRWPREVAVRAQPTGTL